MRKWISIIWLLPALVVALGLRLPQLSARPMHHDEANQAYRFGTLLETGKYEYDPDDHHGPTLYYLTLPIAWLTGAETFAETKETTYRILPVLFGLLLVLCVPLLRSGMGATAVPAAALLTAISPAMAYYSRFYIQEMLLVFFTFLAMAAGWRAWYSGSSRWAAVCGLSAGLMIATKETSVIAYAAMSGSAVLCAIARRDVRIPLKQIVLAAACAVLVAFILYSSFFTDLGGPLESILAFKGYFARGAGIDTDHVHPWSFYLKMLTVYRYEGGPVWSEGLIFGLGLVGGTAILLKKIPAGGRPGFARFLLFYTVLLTVAYSAIAYKTPWCILSLLHGWILLAGIGLAVILGATRRSRGLRLLCIGLLLVPVAATCRLAVRTVYRYAADYHNPYVYAHTAPDFMNLINRIREIEAVSPEGRDLYIQVVADPKETWPLPFYLRGYPNTGYWVETARLPKAPPAALIISAHDFEPDQEHYLTEYYGLRADTLLTIHIRTTLWERFIETRR